MIPFSGPVKIARPPRGPPTFSIMVPSEQTMPIESTASPDFNLIIDNLVFGGHYNVLLLGPLLALRTLFVAATVVLTYFITGALVVAGLVEVAEVVVVVDFVAG